MNTNGQETLRLSPPTRLWQAVKASGNLLWNRKLEGVGRPSRPTDPPFISHPSGDRAQTLWLPRRPLTPPALLACLSLSLSLPPSLPFYCSLSFQILSLMLKQRENQEGER